MILILTASVFLASAPVSGQENPAPSPARVLREYALTSASAREKYSDPNNWQILGSNDGGLTWTVLDVQTNQVFRARSQRRVYPITNQKAYGTYRLLVERAPTVQLAEWELNGPLVGVTNESQIQVIGSASKAHPLLGAANNAFDHDPTSRWIDFGTGQNTCWLQCEYSLEANNVVTNIGEFAVAARRVAAGNPLFEKAPQVLSNYSNVSNRPRRVLSGYALTSANDAPGRDPRDWRLLGSNDRGVNWQTLDARRNEIFPQRYQRRFFSLTNEQPYAMYRLEIDCVRVPANLPGGASCVQLAEVEPVYSSKDPGGKYSLLLSAEGENPPIETLEAAFDGKARTKWLSFTDDDNTNRSSWIQWEYLPGGDPPVLNLRWVKALQAQRPTPVQLKLEGVVVSWDANSNRLGFLDETGFQQFRLQPAGPQALQPGDRIALTGQLELGTDLPTVSRAVVTRLQLTAPPEPLSLGQRLPRGKNFFSATIEARVTSVSEDVAHWTTLGLTSDRGTEQMVAKLNQGRRGLRFFPGCKVKLEGVVQQLLDMNNEPEAGVLWVSSLDQVTTVVTTEKDWSEWPLYTLSRLTRTNAGIRLGTPVRVTGRVARQDSQGIVLEDKGTNRIRVKTESESLLTIGSFGEAVGFLDQQPDGLTLNFAVARPAAEPKARSQRSEISGTAPQRPVTQVNKIYDRLEEQPGKAFPVVLRGVITYIDLEFDSFYIQDETDGIQVLNQLDAGLAPMVKQEGSWIEIHGQIDPEMQAVVPDGFVKVLGKARMPAARRHSWDYLITGKDDSRWIDIEGVVSDLGDAGLTLVVTGGRLAVVVNEFDKRAQEGLLGSLVRISGVCAPMRDNRNRRVGVQLLVPFEDCIEVLRPATEHPFDLATRKIAELLEQDSRSTNLTLRLTKTAGVVTYNEPRLLFIQDGADGMRIMPRTDTPVQPGDRIEAVGFVEPDGFSPRLVQAIVRKIGQDPLPTPNPIDLMVPDVTDQDATRVQLEATLVGLKSGKSMQVLELKADHGDKTFSAFVPAEAEALPIIPIGSRVRLTGVFRSETETMADLGLVPTSFQIYVNSPREIAVLHRPSWWTAQHTLWVAAGLSSILLMALTWASSLRKQVLQRTEQLRVEIAEHKRTEEALATSDRYMRSLVDSLPQNIVRKDLEGRFTFVNEFFCKNIGKPMDQILGKTDFQLFPLDLATKFRNDDQEVIASGKLLETVEQNFNASGESIFVQAIKTPLVDAANQILGIQVIFWDITERKLAEARLEEAQKAMVDASRQAGMAEVAAGVLHNVGNVLNSVNVSANLVSDRLYKSKAGGLGKAVALLREHETDLGSFFNSDPRGKQLIVYLERLSECLGGEQASAIQELQNLKKNIEHIKEIVAMQQSYAKIVGVTEKIKVTDLVEDALRLNSGTLARHEVELLRDYAPNVPEIIVERHKVLQILVNLIRNAKYACDESGRQEKRLVVRVSNGDDCVNIATVDNGVGIAPENITRIFNHGFTTRKDGHGFGLHSGALAAKEMGGKLIAQSEGVGKGACFTLCLPLAPKST
jgi:PAS domain S-box-containing protein